MLKRPWVFGAILVMQTLCAVFFVSDIVLTVIGAPYAPIPWAYREVMELAAGGGLILGVVLGALLLGRPCGARGRRKTRCARPPARSWNWWRSISTTGA
jgi:hypothetical protein